MLGEQNLTNIDNAIYSWIAIAKWNCVKTHVILMTPQTELPLLGWSPKSVWTWAKRDESQLPASCRPWPSVKNCRKRCHWSIQWLQARTLKSQNDGQLTANHNFQSLHSPCTSLRIHRVGTQVMNFVKEKTAAPLHNHFQQHSLARHAGTELLCFCESQGTGTGVHQQKTERRCPESPGADANWGQ